MHARNTVDVEVLDSALSIGALVEMSHYFRRYEATLSDLVGADAASVAASYYKWTVAGIVLILAATPLALFTNPGGSPEGLLLVLAALAGGIACGVRAVSMSSRVSWLASNYLTQHYGRTVRIGGARISLRWWRWKIDKALALREGC